jgi:hypothetical protein
MATCDHVVTPVVTEIRYRIWCNSVDVTTEITMAVRYDQKRKSWGFVFDLPPAEDGKRRQMQRRGYATEKAARDEERAALKRFASVELAADGSVAAELARWAEDRELDLSITGVSTYRDYIRGYVVPHIGQLKLIAVDRDVIHALYRKLLKNGSKRGGPLAPSTVRTLHRILQKAFKDLGLDLAGCGSRGYRRSWRRGARECGRRSSPSPFCAPSRRIGSMPRGCWPWFAGCGGVSWPGCGGPRWTSPAA